MPLLLDYLKLEVEQNERIVVQNNDWVALLPSWATWPYEMLLVPRRQVLRLPDLSTVKEPVWQKFSSVFSPDATIFSKYHSLTPWAGTERRPELVRSSTGNCTSISTRRCCVQHRSRNLWSATRRSPKPSASDRRVGRADAARPAGAPLQIGIHENP